MTALDRPEVIGRHLVGAVDRDMGSVDGIENGSTESPSSVAAWVGLGRGRHAAQTAQAPLGQRLQQERGHRASGAQHHPHVGLDQLGGGPRRLSHLLIRRCHGPGNSSTALLAGGKHLDAEPLTRSSP